MANGDLGLGMFGVQGSMGIITPRMKNQSKHYRAPASAVRVHRNSLHTPFGMRGWMGGGWNEQMESKLEPFRIQGFGFTLVLEMVHGLPQGSTFLFPSNQTKESPKTLNPKPSQS